MIGTDQPPRWLDGWAWVLLAAALALRAGVALFAFDALPHSDDSYAYLRNALNPERLGIPEYADYGVAETAIAPLYPIFLMPFTAGHDGSTVHESFWLVRLAQAALDTITVFCVYLLACQLFGLSVGRVALVAQALDPRYLFYIGAIATEPLFLALMSGALLLYVLAVDQEKMGLYRLSGLAMGLACLTRPVPLLFPLGLAIHALLHPVDRWGKLRGVGWLALIMVLVIAPWNIRTGIIRGNYFLPVTETAFFHFWRGAREATEGDAAPVLTDQEAINAELTAEFDRTYHITPEDYVSAGVAQIAERPLPWLARIAQDTAFSFAQPYGSIILVPPDAPSLVATWRAFLTGQAGAADLLAVPGFWRRMAMYAWQAWCLLFGAGGALLALIERRWNTLPLIGWVAYVTLLMAALLIEPRYVFPVMFALTALGAWASVRLWQGISSRAVMPRPTEFIAE